MRGSQHSTHAFQNNNYNMNNSVKPILIHIQSLLLFQYMPSNIIKRTTKSSIQLPKLCTVHAQSITRAHRDRNKWLLCCYQPTHQLHGLTRSKTSVWRKPHAKHQVQWCSIHTWYRGVFQCSVMSCLYIRKQEITLKCVECTIAFRHISCMLGIHIVAFVV